MQTRALKSLVRISRIGSFAKAAEQLNMTLPALSMQMKALESELAVNLFDRSVRPPRLTPIGRSVVEEATPLLEREDSLLDLCRPHDSLTGRFKIGFVTTAAVRFLPTFFMNAQSQAPNATFEFETGLSRALQTKVVTGQIDAALVTDADGLPDALSEHVIQQDPFVFSAHEQIMSDGLPGLFANHPLFHFMPDTGIGKQIAYEMQAHARPKHARTIVLDNLEAIMECVTAGLGYTLLPKPDVERYRSASVMVIPPPRPLQRTLVLTTRKDGALSKRQAALADLFKG